MLMKLQLLIPTGLLALVCCVAQTHAAFIVEVHISGKANANFAIIPGAGDATGATASAMSSAVGLSGTNSIFSSNNTVAGVVDVYQFSYTPGVDADNTAFTAGDALGNSSAADADGAARVSPFTPRRRNSRPASQVVEPAFTTCTSRPPRVPTSTLRGLCLSSRVLPERSRLIQLT